MEIRMNSNGSFSLIQLLIGTFLLSLMVNSFSATRNDIFECVMYERRNKVRKINYQD